MLPFLTLSTLLACLLQQCTSFSLRVPQQQHAIAKNGSMKGNLCLHSSKIENLDVATRTHTSCLNSAIIVEHREHDNDVPRMLSRRETIQSTFLSLCAITTATSVSFPKSCFGYEPDSDPLRESLYLMSRVQEATVQQERFVRKATDQQALKNKMKLTLLLIEKNYKLVDQITFASTSVPSEHLVEATEAGNEAAEELQSAIDYVRGDLKSGPLEQKQKDFIIGSLQNARESLFVFLDFMPQQKLEEARKRVEEENKANIEEFDGDDDAGVYNPVVLPWKNRTKK